VRPCLESKELFAQPVFVSLLRGLHLAADFVFLEVRLLPLIDLRYRMIDRSQRLFLPDRRDPFLDRRLVGALHLIEARRVIRHFMSPRSTLWTMSLPPTAAGADPDLMAPLAEVSAVVKRLLRLAARRDDCATGATYSGAVLLDVSWPADARAPGRDC
jgi:hypothetical protein